MSTFAPGLASSATSSFLRADERAVLAGQADGLAARLVDQRDDLLVHRPAEDHLDHVHRLGVGHAHALHELALLAEPREHALDLRPAAVDHDRVHADELQQHHVVREALLQRELGHRVAAVLHDDRLAVEAADVGQRLGEDLRLQRGGCGSDGHAADSTLAHPGLRIGRPANQRFRARRFAAGRRRAGTTAVASSSILAGWSSRSDTKIMLMAGKCRPISARQIRPSCGRAAR